MTAPVAARVTGEGPDVLLLHGQPGSSGDWSGVARALSGRFRVIVPDRPGWGVTGGEALGIAGNAEAMVALLDSVGSECATVAGHSWGAAAALALAERAPSRVRALVLLCPVTPGDRLGRVDRLLADRGFGAAATRAGFWAAGTALSTAALRRLITRLLPGIDPELTPEIAHAWRRGTLWRSFHREQRALFDELPALADGLADLSVPTTVVVGAHDRITSPAAGRAFAASVGARLVDLPRAGHLLPMQAPGQVADAIAGAAD